MNCLHLFNPENDLALAVNSPYFTPPAAAIKLARAAACLPLWYAGEGDFVLVHEIDCDWLENITQRFDLKVKPVISVPENITSLSPWGWSRHARELFRRAGASDILLPDDSMLDNCREYSHRRVSIAVYNYLAGIGLPYLLPDFPVELSSVERIEENLNRGCQMFLKSPLSGSGRGIIDTASVPPRQSLRLAAGVIKHQGSIIMEPRLDKISDFAMLFDMADGQACFAGYSSFFNAGYSTYSGNVLMTDAKILQSLCDRGVPSSWIHATREAVAAALERVIGRKYNGPLGVDMMVYNREEKPCIAPCVEVNLRMTMGRVARELTRRYLDRNSNGVMEVVQHSNNQYFNDGVVVDGRLVHGGVNLTPPANDKFSVVMKTL